MPQLGEYPVCPECGYSLRVAASDRCSECGVTYPQTGLRPRRWAIRRLRWERSRRNGLVFGYVATLLHILACPCTAGRRVAVPDRLGRAIRWALVHVLVGALAASLLCDDHYFVRRVRQLGVARPHPWVASFMELQAPPAQASAWFLQSFVAWGAALAVPVAVGIIVIALHPRRDRLWRHTASKWTLYATPYLLLLVSAWHAFYLVLPPGYDVHVGITMSMLGPVPDVPGWFLGLPYGALWACGLSGNVHDRSVKSKGLRCAVRTAGYFALYAVVWFVAKRWVFPSGGLEALL